MYVFLLLTCSKVLKTTSEELPEIACLFKTYKQLKVSALRFMFPSFGLGKVSEHLLQIYTILAEAAQEVAR